MFQDEISKNEISPELLVWLMWNEKEWGGQLTMNEKDVSHPFMTMILTCVTIVGWADVKDNDRGDFRRRHAVDISSSKQAITSLYSDLQ